MSNIVPLSVVQTESQRSWLSERTPLVHTKGNRVFATSKDVATFFEKTHFNVLQDIDRLIAEAPGIDLGFQSIELPVKVGFGTRWDRAFEMDRDGFSLLAMGFTGPKALRFKVAYIAAFNEALKRLEAPVRTPAVALPNFSNPAEAARAWALQWERSLRDGVREGPAGHPRHAGILRSH